MTFTFTYKFNITFEYIFEKVFFTLFIVPVVGNPCGMSITASG